MIRINKFLADSGVASRRGADALIDSGVVKVNGKILREQGISVDPLKDVITVKGKRLGETKKKLIYVAVNKPRGYVSTVKDSHADKTVMDLVPIQDRVYPVGRLDKDSEGLILLTNDGDFALKLTHPRYHVSKTYHVLVRGNVSEDVLNRLRRGVRLEDGVSKAFQVKVIEAENGESWIEMVLHEGKKRQIRRMCAEVHLYVVRLIRVAIGDVLIDDLKIGKWRELTSKEINSLM